MRLQLIDRAQIPFLTPDGILWANDEHVGGDNYQIAFPAFSCGDTVNYYLSVNTTGGDTVTSPFNAPASSWETIAIVGIIEISLDEFEADSGWTVGDTGDNATTGVWNRMDPQPTDAQPGDDVSPGGTQCWVTDGRAGSSIGDFDVDNGKTTLKSPVLDLSSIDDPVISYWRWYSNDKGADPNNDTFKVDITDGGAWIRAQTVGPSGEETSGGWRYHEFRVADFVTPNATVQLRFIAEDAASGSIIEAALDDFRVSTYDCGGDCIADFNGDGVVNTQDVLAFLNAWNADDPDADVNGDGTIDTQDVLAFLNLWNAGC